MKRAAFAFAALIAMGACAHAGGSKRVTADGKAKEPECLTLDQYKAKGKETAAALEQLAKVSGEPTRAIKLPDAFTKTTPAQFHFLQGIYVMNPQTPPGLPPADGASLATHGKDPDGQILWTKGDLDKGGVICGTMDAPKILTDMMKDGKIKTAPGEGETL